MTKLLGFKRWPRVVKVLSVLLVCALLYWIVQNRVVYTEDAYVKVDSIPVASQVEGRVIAIYVRNNDVVKAGEPLLKIDPTPFVLARDIAAGNLANAQKTLPILTAQIQASEADIASNQAQLTFLLTTQRRDQSLFRAGVVSKQDLDNIDSQVLVSEAALTRSRAMVLTLQKTYQRQLTNIGLMNSQLGLAQYNLDQTTVVAGAAGVITSFDTYVGAYLKVGDPLFTLVSNQNWRVVANIKEYDLPDVRVGQKVWIYVGSSPMHLYRGTVHSIARGVARSAAATRPLEYVDPTVDWIRYDYRFPVTIYFDHSPAHLYMGADARIWIFNP